MKFISVVRPIVLYSNSKELAIDFPLIELVCVKEREHTPSELHR